MIRDAAQLLIGSVETKVQIRTNPLGKRTKLDRTEKGAQQAWPSKDTNSRKAVFILSIRSDEPDLTV